MQDSQPQATKQSDEFSKLKILALELKNMQLKLLKDLNPNALNQNRANPYNAFDSKATNPNTRAMKLN